VKCCQVKHRNQEIEKRKEKKRRKSTTAKPEIILSHALLNKVVPSWEIENTKEAHFASPWAVAYAHAIQKRRDDSLISVFNKHTNNFFLLIKLSNHHWYYMIITKKKQCEIINIPLKSSQRFFLFQRQPSNHTMHYKWEFQKKKKTLSPMFFFFFFYF